MYVPLWIIFIIMTYIFILVYDNKKLKETNEALWSEL